MGWATDNAGIARAPREQRPGCKESRSEAAALDAPLRRTFRMVTNVLPWLKDVALRRADRRSTLHALGWVVSLPATRLGGKPVSLRPTTPDARNSVAPPLPVATNGTTRRWPVG